MCPSSETLEMENTGQLPLDFVVRAQVSAAFFDRVRKARVLSG